MSVKKVILLMTVLAMATLCLTGCSSSTLGYRKYPYVQINPSPMGDFIKIRLPLDDKQYVYGSYSCEYTEEGIDLTIRFTKNGSN